jgi:acylphosphatase
MKICKKCIVSGRVQGVFYRHATLQQANALGLTGWVRNLDNGSVEALICGEASSVEALCAWLHEGPPTAEVDSVEIEDATWEEHTHFVILR